MTEPEPQDADLAQEVETAEGSEIFEMIPNFNPVVELDFLLSCSYILSGTSASSFTFGSFLKENWNTIKSQLYGNMFFFGGIFIAKNISTSIRALVARKLFNFIYPEKSVYIGNNLINNETVVREVPDGSRYLVKIGSNLFTILLFYPIETIIFRCLSNNMQFASIPKLFFSWGSFSSLYWGIGNELMYQSINGFCAVIEELILYEFSRPQGWRRWLLLSGSISILMFSFIVGIPIQMQGLFLRTGVPYEFSVKRYARFCL